MRLLILLSIAASLQAAGGTLKVRVLDADRKTVTAARVNVIGADNAFYQPAQNPLAQYNLNHTGNRNNVSPLRYFGSFFYTEGNFELTLPPGVARVEVSKGYSYYTSIGEVKIEDGKTANYEVTLQRVIDMPRYGWHSTDTHLHFDRSDPAADGPILQMLSAEDIEMGHILTKQSAKGYGVDSLNSSGRYSIVSGREVTANGIGHINQLMFKNLPAPVPGVPIATLYDQAIADGGAMQHDHAGYGQEIYADVVLGKSDAVELIQFGLYRFEIGLDGYYLLLNSGFRYPLLGASDYPVCREMSDSRTFVADGSKPSFPTAVGRIVRGQSFATSMPLLFLSVNGKGPANDIDYSGTAAQPVTVEVHAVSGDMPFDSVEIVQDGKVVDEWHGSDPVFRKELKTTLRLSESSWIAARCSGPGTVHAHTNPVWIYFNGRAPFKPGAARELLSRIRAYENTRISAEVKAVVKAAEAKLDGMTAPVKPAPLERFPVTASDAALFPPVLPRPKVLAPVKLEGTAVDKLGQPLAGVEVLVRGVGPRVRTDATGSFVLPGVDVNTPLFLRLSKDGYATTNTTYLNPRSPKENLRVVLVTNAEVTAIMQGAPQTRGATSIVLIGGKSSGLKFKSSPQMNGSPGAGTTRFFPAPGFAAASVTQISFQPSSPALKNDHEPNVIITATPFGKDMVMPVFVGQVTYSLFQ